MHQDISRFFLLKQEKRISKFDSVIKKKIMNNIQLLRSHRRRASKRLSFCDKAQREQHFQGLGIYFSRLPGRLSIAQRQSQVSQMCSGGIEFKGFPHTPPHPSRIEEHKSRIVHHSYRKLCLESRNNRCQCLHAAHLSIFNRFFQWLKISLIDAYSGTHQASQEGLNEVTAQACVHERGPDQDYLALSNLLGSFFELV